MLMKNGEKLIEKLSFVDATEKVLAERDEPLHDREITHRGARDRALFPRP